MRAGDVPFPAPREAAATWDDAEQPEDADAKPRADTASTELVSSGPASSTLLEGPEAARWAGLPFAQDLWPLRSYASCAEDVHLLSAFLELSPLTHLPLGAGKLLFRVLRFLRLCDYHVEDTCVILAHASAYFLDAFGQCGSHMQDSEVGNVLATLIFIAHCYVQDETCPLHVWHKHLFKRYCDLKVLNQAVMRLMALRLALRISDDDLRARLSRLAGAISCFGNVDESFARLVPQRPNPNRQQATSPASGSTREANNGYGSRPMRYCS
ncbi:unnamed protein product [Effrenium voratum]|nr:unnamed protein product [Effrenium voratum]